MNDIINSQTAPEPVGAYPHARRAGDFLFLSGVGPRQKGTSEIPGVSLNEEGAIMEYDIKVQTQAVIDNVRLILASAQAKMTDIVDIQVFLTNMSNDFKGFNEVYKKTFTDLTPTRTTVEVGSLPTPIAVEFKVIAYVGS